MERMDRLPEGRLEDAIGETQEQIKNSTYIPRLVCFPQSSSTVRGTPGRKPVTSAEVNLTYIPGSIY